MRLVKPQHILSKRRAVVVVEVSVMLRSTFINHGYGKQKYVQGSTAQAKAQAAATTETRAEVGQEMWEKNGEGRGGGLRERMLTQVVRHE